MASKLSTTFFKMEVSSSDDSLTLSAQMDSVLSSLIRAVDPKSKAVMSNNVNDIATSQDSEKLDPSQEIGLEDTIIFVVGDHGMTAEGKFISITSSK